MTCKIRYLPLGIISFWFRISLTLSLDHTYLKPVLCSRISVSGHKSISNLDCNKNKNKILKHLNAILLNGNEMIFQCSKPYKILTLILFHGKWLLEFVCSSSRVLYRITLDAIMQMEQEVFCRKF